MQTCWTGSSSSRWSGTTAAPASSTRPRYLPLHHPEVVAGRVAEAGVDAVRLLRRLLQELDAALLELVVALLDVVGGEEEAARRALGEQVVDLLPRVLVEDGRPGN